MPGTTRTCNDLPRDHLASSRHDRCSAMSGQVTQHEPATDDHQVAMPVPHLDDVPSRWSFEGRRDAARRGLTIAVLIALGATSAIQIQGFTSTMLTPVCLLLVPALFLTRPTLGQWLPLALAVIGFTAFCISAQINHLSLVDERVQECAAFAVYFVGFLVLAGRDLLRIFAIFCGIAVGASIYSLLPGSASAGFYTSLADVWKYGVGQWVVIILLFGLIILRVSLPLQAVALILVGAYSLELDYRSLATNSALAGVIVLFSWAAKNRIPRWLQLTLVAVSGMSVYTVLPKLATSGMFGDAIQRKTESQLAQGVPLILAGRTESPLSISAISERPWFGWASANNISAEAFDHAKSLAISLGFDPSVDVESGWYFANGDVSLHSVLLGSWAEGGMFAALLPLGLVLAAVAMIWNAPRYGRWVALVLVVSIQAVWDLFFSRLLFRPGTCPQMQSAM
jgi:hypothetical protein